jgi:hypothetical protein
MVGKHPVNHSLTKLIIDKRIQTAILINHETLLKRFRNTNDKQILAVDLTNKKTLDNGLCLAQK